MRVAVRRRASAHDAPFERCRTPDEKELRLARLLESLNKAGLAASSSWLGGVFYHVVCRRIDSVLIPLSGGRLSMGPPGQTVLITTTGARSGKPRKASLAFLWEGEDMVIVASKGGAPHHPGWYHNLKAHPQLSVQYPGVVEERVAREAEGTERDVLFERMARTFSNFDAYQRRATNRKIPVMVLSPVDATRV